MSENHLEVAVMFADIEGYTTIMSKSESHAVSLVEQFEREIKAGVEAYNGELRNFYGDGCLVTFSDLINSLEAATQLQIKFQSSSVPVRIGIHVGKVLLKENNVFGLSVNVASRIESLGKVGAVVVSENFCKKTLDHPGIEYKKMGDFHFKNVDQMMGVYSLVHPELVVIKRGNENAKLEKNNVDGTFSRSSPSDQHAKRSYLKGLKLIEYGGGNHQELHQAIKLFEETIEIEPEFADGYLSIAQSYLSQVYWGRVCTNEIIPNAKAAAEKALELDPDSHRSLGSMGNIEFYNCNLNSAEEYLLKSFEGGTPDVTSVEVMAWIKVYREKFDEAFSLFEQASNLDPLSLRYATDIAHIYYYNRNFERGQAYLNGLKIRYPNEPFVYWINGYFLSGAGRYEEALENFYMRETVGKKSNWMIGYCLGKLGRMEEAQDILDFHLNKLKFSHVPAYMIATICAGMGRDKETIEWLRKDHEQGGTGHFFINLYHDPKFSHLHDYPEFQELVNVIK